MTKQKGICEECKKEFEYDYNPKYPRKYCHPCGTAKQQAYADANVPVERPGQTAVPPAQMPALAKPKANGTSFYTAYAKDIFVAMYSKEVLTNDQMSLAIQLVKQAKEAFE